MLVASILQNKGNDVLTISPDATIRNAVSMLKGHGIGSLVVSTTDRRIRHVPVVDNGELCGMVSIGDAVKARLDEVTHEADALREYIAHT
ncbi:MAG: CBS domain-containing protein [Alphaproteobacteria bacterium]|nr:CBS domain-containing protein [Alphaproteobacteria bacterium]